MKKNTKIIDGDKVTIYQGRQVDLDDDLAPEYDLNKYEWKPNPYAKRLREQSNKLTVQLDADIAKYFENSRAVNLFLRKQINLIQKVVNV
jgi:hypothetical protein